MYRLYFCPTIDTTYVCSLMLLSNIIQLAKKSFFHNVYTCNFDNFDDYNKFSAQPLLLCESAFSRYAAHTHTDGERFAKQFPSERHTHSTAATVYYGCNNETNNNNAFNLPSERCAVRLSSASQCSYIYVDVVLYIHAHQQLFKQ